MSKIRILFGMFLFVFVFSLFDLTSLAAYDHSGSVDLDTSSYSADIQETYSDIVIYPNPDPSTLYEVNISFRYDVTFTQSVYLRNLYIRYGNVTFYSARNGLNTTGSSFSHYNYGDRTLYLKGSQLNNQDILMVYRVSRNSSSTLNYESAFTFNVLSVKPLDTDSAAAYTEGYNVGYNQGFTQGQNSGYSDGFSDGYSQGEESGYNSGFSAGVDSVDTQSYYDAGYNAGESAGYADGYDAGYDDGFDAAMSRYEGWGADNTVYPVEVYSVPTLNGYITFDCDIDNYAYYKDTDGGGFYRYSFTGDYYSSSSFIDQINYSLDPNHIYKIVLTDYYTEFDGSGSFFLNIGSSSFEFSSRSESDKTDVSVFAHGSDLGSNIGFRIEGICHSSGSSAYNMYVFFNDFILYDYGPVGNTQNQIANQTDDLTNGYDSSSGDAASNTFADNAASYEQAESSIFTSAKSSLDSFEFYDLSSDSSLLTGLSFVASTMTAIFGAMGGLTGGAGIVLSVLFSVILVSIVIGTYRYFVSSGKTHSSGSKKGGKG